MRKWLLILTLPLLTGWGSSCNIDPTIRDNPIQVTLDICAILNPQICEPTDPKSFETPRWEGEPCDYTAACLPYLMCACGMCIDPADFKKFWSE